MKRILTFMSLVFLFSNMFAKNEHTPVNKTENTFLEQFISSKKFIELKSSFNLIDKDFDFSNISKAKYENGQVETIQINVYKNSKINRLTVLKLIGSNEFKVLYEKNDLNKLNTAGYFEFYNEKGEFYADYKVQKEGNQLHFKLNEIGKSIRLGAEGLNDTAGSCVTDTYKFIKETCEKDSACDFFCDLDSGCHIKFMIIAAAHCLVAPTPAGISQ